MPFLAPLAGIVSGVAGIAGALGGGASTPKVKQLPGQQQAGQDVLDINSGMSNVPGQLMPQYQSIVQGLMSNPYSTQAQQGANTASGYGAGAAERANQGSIDLGSLTQSMIPYAQQLGVAAFDPQQALYDRTLHQVQEQQRVGQAARGITMSPYGAGLEGDATRNFNIDWQNNQLQRMLQGAQGLSGLTNTIGQGFSGAAQLGEGAMGLANAAGTLPYATNLGMGQDSLALLDTLSKAGINANAIPQQQIQNLLQYLGQGNASNNTAINAAGQSFGQNQTLGGNLGTALSTFAPGGTNAGFFSTLGNLFGGGQQNLVSNGTYLGG